MFKKRKLNKRTRPNVEAAEEAEKRQKTSDNGDEVRDMEIK